MSNTVIKVENVSKQYRLGQIGTGSMAHDVNRLWHRLRGKPDPYIKIGEENDRTRKGDSEYVWALNDINFEVKQGDVLGIIGRNGAGKSTLLKLLSRTTLPTTGNIKIKGRIASLLEVGTGFHPELTGRDNIYLNGAILGMTKAEIKKNFDAIVDFSGVEKYIDTPVKRYSSGMYVRLAFAVAAHLESEILIVDEVLAVGDAEFQKKCIGKMEDVSRSNGKTVLLVSHQMGTIAQICNKALALNNGRLTNSGNVEDVINNYLNHLNQTGFNNYIAEVNKSKIYFSEVWTTDINDSPKSEFSFYENVLIKARLKIGLQTAGLKVGVTIQNIYGGYISTTIHNLENKVLNEEIMIEVKLPSSIIAPNTYYFRVAVFSDSKVYEVIENICQIKIIDTGSSLALYEGVNYGSVILDVNWKIQSYEK